MKTGNEKRTVISLSDESFRHYLIERYSKNDENSGWKRLKEISQDLITTDTWIRLYNRAKADLEQSGGRLIGYEVVDEVLVSHERIHSQWPMNLMWVMQFNDGTYRSGLKSHEE
jgi:uncharacterized protein YjaZ